MALFYPFRRKRAPARSRLNDAGICSKKTASSGNHMSFGPFQGCRKHFKMEKSTRKAEDQGAPPILQCDAGSVFICPLQFLAVSHLPMQPLSSATVVARNQPRHGDAKW